MTEQFAVRKLQKSFVIISAWLGTVQFTEHKGHIQTVAGAKGPQTAGQMKQKEATKENPSTKRGKRKEDTQRKGTGRLAGHGVRCRWSSSGQRNHVTFLFGGQHLSKTAHGPRSHLGNLSNGEGEPSALHGGRFFPITQAAVPTISRLLRRTPPACGVLSFGKEATLAALRVDFFSFPCQPRTCSILTSS